MITCTPTSNWLSPSEKCWGFYCSLRSLSSSNLAYLSKWYWRWWKHGHTLSDWPFQKKSRQKVSTKYWQPRLKNRSASCSISSQRHVSTKSCQNHSTPKSSTKVPRLKNFSRPSAKTITHTILIVPLAPCSTECQRLCARWNERQSS